VVNFVAEVAQPPREAPEGQALPLGVWDEGARFLAQPRALALRAAAPMARLRELCLALGALPGAVRASPPRHERPPVRELAHVLKDDDAGLRLGRPATDDPGQAADVLADRLAALGAREVLAVRRGPLSSTPRTCGPSRSRHALGADAGERAEHDVAGVRPERQPAPDDVQLQRADVLLVLLLAHAPVLQRVARADVEPDRRGVPLPERDRELLDRCARSARGCRRASASSPGSRACPSGSGSSRCGSSCGAGRAPSSAASRSRGPSRS
jgi:hypothetical protein